MKYLFPPAKEKAFWPLLAIWLLFAGTLTSVALFREKKQSLLKKGAGEETVMELTALNQSTNNFNAQPNQSFRVALNLLPNTTEGLCAVDVVLDFDVSRLILEDISPNLKTNLKTFAPVITDGSFDKQTVISQANASGVIQFGAVAYSAGEPTSPQVSPVTPLATFIFRVKPGVSGEAKVWFGSRGFASLGASDDSNALKCPSSGSSALADILKAPTSQIKVNIGTSVVPTPTSAIPTPTQKPTPTMILGVAAMVKISPESQSVSSNAQTAINIEVTKIANLYGFQLDLRYNDAVLDYLNWSKGDFFQKATDANQPFWVNPQTSSGLIKQIAVTRLDPDPPLSGSGKLFTVTFSSHSSGTATIMIENAIFLDRNGNKIPVNLRDGRITVSGGTVIPTATGKPTPTKMPLPTGPIYPAKINFQVKLSGTTYQVGGQSVTVNDIPQLPFKVIVKSNDYQEVFDQVMVDFDQQAVGRGRVEFQGTSATSRYAVLIKGPVHLAKRFCRNNQADYCAVKGEGFPLKQGDNNFNWTGDELEPGDLNTDGVADTLDFALLKKAIGKQTRVLEDINFNGQVDTQDLVFLLKTLSVRYDDEI